MDLSRDDRYSKTCVKLKNRQELSPRQNKDLNDIGSLMKVKSIAAYSLL